MQHSPSPQVIPQMQNQLQQLSIRLEHSEQNINDTISYNEGLTLQMRKDSTLVLVLFLVKSTKSTTP